MTHSMHRNVAGQVPGISLLVGIAFGVAIAGVTGMLSSLGQDDAWVAPLAVVALFVAAIALIRSLGRAAAHPRPGAAAALGAAGLAPVAFFAAWQQLDAPLGTTSRADELEMAAAVLAFAVVAAAGWRLTARACDASRAAAALSLGASALVATAGVIAAFDRPAPAAYLANLEHVASWRSDRDGSGFEEHRPSGGTAVGGTCVGSGCYAHLRRGDAVQPVSLRFERGSTLDLVRDPSDDTLLLRANGSLLALFSASGDELVPNPAALADRVGPPPSFALLACAGLFGGLVALALRRRHQRERRALERASAGYVSEHGWLEAIDHEPPLRLPDPPEAGPVLVTSGSVSTPYRGAPLEAPPSIVAGTREALLERLDARVGALDALALSWVLVLAMPMAAALVRGLVP